MPPTIDLHGAEVIPLPRQPAGVTVGPSSIVGLVGAAPDTDMAIAATLTIGTGAAALTVTAVAVGRAGNQITVVFVDPAANSQALAVVIDGDTITVTLATNGTGNITTTAAQLVTAWNAQTAVAAKATLARASSGAGGVLAAFPAAPLAGGADAAFPLDTPVLLNTAAQAAELGTSGSLPAAVRDVARTAGRQGATIVVVRVAADSTAALLGDRTARTGLYALLNAEAHTGQRPRLVAVPGLRASAVTIALEALAAELHAVAVVTLDAATVQAAITASPQLGHVYAVWPPLVVVDGGAEVERPADALVIGHLVRTDREASYAASPSNRILPGVLRTDPPVDWVVDARSSSANLLNRAFVTTAIRRGAGVYLWGNRLSDGTLITHRRARAILGDELVRFVLDWIDRKVDLPFVEFILQRMNGFLRTQTLNGTIRSGRARFDAQYNTAETLAAHQVTFSFELGLHDLAEHIIFRQAVSGVGNEILEQLTAQGRIA